MLLKNIAVSLILSCSAIYTAFGHPHCHYDLREVDLERELTFCPMDYADAGVCCTAEEEAALEGTFTAASDLTTECADYYQQLLCGVCGSYSGHLYERLADELETDASLTMKSEFCAALTTACDGQIEFLDYDTVDYCTMHTGGGEDLWWSYPYEMSGIFDADFTEVFPNLPDSDKPGTTLAMHQSPDESMFWMAGQEGMLLRVDTKSSSNSSTVLDLSGDNFYESYEEGLLDFTFSPMFNTNGFFYVSWTVNESYVKNRLSKFQYYEGDPDATRDSEEVLLESAERTTFMHNGGWLGFKPSDYSDNDYDTDSNYRRRRSNCNYHDLYWALGDSGPQQDTNDHGQRTDILFGSVVRISVPSDGTGYNVPDENYPDADLPEICAIGFRNNWRCGFDRLTDDLYCGDVGHQLIESIDIIECGNNYGWVRFEGSRCTEYSEDTYGSCADADRSNYTFPIFEYCHFDFDPSSSSEDVYSDSIDICGDRSVEGTTVIGGYVYRGQAYADLIYGAYVFADYTARNIYYIIQQDDGTWTSGTIISDASVAVYSFSEDMDGELFIIDENNDIYYLPCGDLCDEEGGTTTSNNDGESTSTASDDDESTSSTTDDDESTSSTTDDDEGTSSTSDDDESTSSTSDDESTSTTESYVYLGCYADDSNRVFSGQAYYYVSGLTTEACAEVCDGSTYFGTQSRDQCFCGEATDDPTILGSATCDLACSGNLEQICGGTWALSVYEYTS